MLKSGFISGLVLQLHRVLHAVSGGFYADNGREQSVLYRPLARREKQELQEELLHLLGLQHRPRPRQHDTQSSAPKYLLDIFEAFEKDPLLRSVDINNGSRRAVSDSDVIVSFVNRIHHKSPHLRHEKERRFYFDLSEVSPEQELVGAELRIYRESQKQKNTMQNQKYKLTLCSVVEGNEADFLERQNTLQVVDDMVVSDHKDGWMVFNVTGPIMEWIAFPSKNFGLYLKIKLAGQTEAVATPQEIGLIGPKGPDEKQAFMVAYFKTSTQFHIRKTRAAKKRQHESYYDQNAWNPYSKSIQDKYSSRRSCQRWTLYVGFKDLGWQDWIIAPDGFGAFYCHGECSFPLNAHMNATNHAIVQTLVHLMDPSVVPKPCCAPTQLSAITVLYFDDNSNVILKKYKNMVVKSCGCH